MAENGNNQTDRQSKVASAQGIRDIIERKRLAEKMRQEILAVAQKEAEEIKARARDEAASERAQVAADLQKQAAELAMQMTRKIVGEGIDEQSQKKLIDQFLANLGDAS